MNVLTLSRFRELADYGRGLVILPLPPPRFIDEYGEVFASSGIYVITTRSDHPLYTGSARRPADARGLVNRMHEHLRREDRRLRWLRAWLMPMSDNAALHQVQLVEGMVGRDLGCSESLRLPRTIRQGRTLKNGRKAGQ